MSVLGLIGAVVFAVGFINWVKALIAALKVSNTDTNKSAKLDALIPVILEVVMALVTAFIFVGDKGLFMFAALLFGTLAAIQYCYDWVVKPITHFVEVVKVWLVSAAAKLGIKL
jgi:hypothetical protein